MSVSAGAGKTEADRHRRSPCAAAPLRRDHQTHPPENRCAARRLNNDPAFGPEREIDLSQTGLPGSEESLNTSRRNDIAGAVATSVSTRSARLSEAEPIIIPV